MCVSSSAQPLHTILKWRLISILHTPELPIITFQPAQEWKENLSYPLLAGRVSVTPMIRPFLLITIMHKLYYRYLQECQHPDG